MTERDSHLSRIDKPKRRKPRRCLTKAERDALREAATFRLSGEMEEERYRKALERALEKL